MSFQDRYELREKLGAGGMGAVYVARDRLTNEIVALKRVFITPDEESVPGSGDKREYLTAIATEFRTLAGLHHPHIVRVIDYGFTLQGGESKPYFTMEYLPGARSITKAATGETRETQVRLLNEMLLALAYLHRRGVIHRDVKPDNVLVDSDGRVKVLDFGLASGTTAKSDTDWKEGTVGTIAYMAPELFQDEPSSVSSDLYAVGIIAYQVFTGGFPFNQKNLMVLLNEIMTHAPNTAELDADLGELLERILAKDPAQRPVEAYEVIRALCAATKQPLPTESAVIRESFLQASRFVGRDAEMAQLKAALDRIVTAGEHRQAQVFLIGGESGVGKSRLLDELRTRALVRGALVLRGQGIAEGGLPYQLWRGAMRELALSTPLTDFEVSVLKELVPDIGTLLGRGVTDPPELTGAAGQQRLVLTLLDALKRQTRPVVLLLEDLQWADESLAPIQQILAVREQYPHLLVLGTFRDDERPHLPDELPGAQSLKLHRLNDDAIADLAQSMLGEAGIHPDVLSTLKRETEGNAFFMVETVRALAEEAGALSEIGKVTLPARVFTGGIQQIVRRRLSRVPDTVRPLLKCAAVAGRQIDTRVLQSLLATRNGTSLHDSAGLEAFLTTCANAGVFEMTEGQWRFAHDKLRETILQDLDEAERRDLHRATAVAIESVYPADDNYDQVLMEHWRAADNAQKELHYLVGAVKRLLSINADYAHAIQLAERGLALAADDDPSRPTLLNHLSRAYESRADYAAAHQWAEQARLAAEKRDDKQGIADSLKSLGVLADDQGDYASAAVYFQQSLAIAREIGDRVRTSANLNSLGIVAYHQGNYATTVDYYQESMAIAREIGNSYRISVTLGNLGNLAYHQGNFTTATDYFEQSLAITREIGDRQGLAFGLNNLGLALLAQNTSTAAAHLREALGLCHEIGMLSLAMETIVGLARLRLRAKDAIFAAEIAGLVDHHPATEPEIQQGELATLKRELEDTLPADELGTALQDGMQMDLDLVIRRLLSENDN